MTLYLSKEGGIAHHFRTPYISTTADNLLRLTSVAQDTGDNLTITVLGYEI